MGLCERDAPARLEGHDIDVHVVAQIAWVRKTLGRPSAIGIGHGNRRDFVVMGHECLRRIHALHGHIALAHPVQAARRIAGVPQRPFGGRGNIGVRPCHKIIPLPIQRQPRAACGHEQDRLRLRVRLGRVAATFGGKLYRVLREGFGKSAQRPRQYPRACVYPSGQQAGHDVPLHRGRDHRVGVGEHSRAFRRDSLVRQTAGGEGIGHSISSSRSRAIRSTCAHAVVNSSSVALAMRVSNWRRMPSLS